MGIESYQPREKSMAQPEEHDTRLHEKSGRLRSALNEIKSIILSGGLTVTLGVGLGLGGGKLTSQYIEARNKAKDRVEMVARAGEAGGRLFDRFGYQYKINTDLRIERGHIPESHEPMNIGEIEALENTISAKTLKTIIEKTYPKGWFKNNMADIKQGKPDVTEFIAKDKRKWDTLAVAFDMTKEGKAKSSIVFNQEVSRGWPVGHLINHTLSHESCHAVEHGLSIADSNNLFEAVAERIEAPDRFQSEYVENIEDADKKARDFSKAQEYWAEICAQFFNDPTQLHIKDFRMVSEQVKKVDPAFNWKTASKHRKDIVYDNVKKYYAKNRS